ncbi:hypothetical protein MVEN_00934900 [Mycena venus]|uniref:Uncharacterized protein n=1 Tax=Mycena venus TaxID=2733690 RepID=A0A8H7D1W8_9AGAR|nr:hypothetical protein MVEN_00934900 [Mycena venus]
MPSDRNLFLTSSSQRSATIAINSISTQSALPSTAVNTFAILPDSPPQSTSYPLAPSESVAELMRSAIDSIPLVHDAQKLSSLARTVPFFDPAVGFLFQIIKSYTEIKTTNYKRDALLAWVMGITQDLCATIDEMEETKHGDLILCLEPDVKRLARLLGETSKFVAEYDRRGAVRRITARHQLAGRLSALQQEIDSFGPRFRASMITVIKSDFNAQDISLSVEDCRLWEAFRNRLIKHEVQAVLQIETDQFIVRPEDNHKQLVSKGNWEEWISSPGSDSHFQLRRVVLCTIQNACLCYPRPPNYKDSLQCETCQMQCVEESDELLDPLGPQRLPSNDRRDSTESITPVSSISWPEERTARKIQSSTPTPLSLPTSTMFLPTTPPSPGPPFEMPPASSLCDKSLSICSFWSHCCRRDIIGVIGTAYSNHNCSISWVHQR